MKLERLADILTRIDDGESLVGKITNYEIGRCRGLLDVQENIRMRIVEEGTQSTPMVTGLTGEGKRVLEALRLLEKHNFLVIG